MLHSSANQEPLTTQPNNKNKCVAYIDRVNLKLNPNMCLALTLLELNKLERESSKWRKLSWGSVCVSACPFLTRDFQPHISKSWFFRPHGPHSSVQMKQVRWDMPTPRICVRRLVVNRACLFSVTLEWLYYVLRCNKIVLLDNSRCVLIPKLPHCFFDARWLQFRFFLIIF